MREIVVISGKGGTGKTSVCASLAPLAQNKVVCDLDVDAPDMHILLYPVSYTHLGQEQQAGPGRGFKTEAEHGGEHGNARQNGHQQIADHHADGKERHMRCLLYTSRCV